MAKTPLDLLPYPFLCPQATLKWSSGLSVSLALSAANAMAESERLLQLAAHYLSLRDWSNCRKYALLAQQTSDPNLPSPHQILAIADVLLAADRRIGGSAHRDWYSILQIRHRDHAANPTLRDHFKRLMLLLHPSKNQFAFSGEAFSLVFDAWSVLSNAQKKARYDCEIGSEEEKTREEEQGFDTFWTACPYCFYVYEYYKVYEECCLRCQNCRRPFHGAAMGAPPPSAVLDGKEAYFCSNAFFPLGYSNDGELKEKNVGVDNTVNEKNVGVDNRVNEKNVGAEKTVNEKKVMRNVKTVARNTKKLMGTGRMRSGRKSELKQVNGDEETVGVEFFDGGNDIIVGLWST